MHRLPPLIATLLLVTPGPGAVEAQERPLPDTPAGRRATHLLEALGGDEAHRRAFVRDALAAPDAGEGSVDWEGRLRRLASELEAAERVGVRLEGPHEIVLAYRSPEGGEVRISLRVEEEPPHRIAGLGVEAGDAGGGTLSFGSWEELDARLRELEARDRFAGVVLAARAGETLFHRAYGMARRDPPRPVRPDTRFNVGSLLKPMTGVLVLRLAQEGRIDLDAPVGEYVDGLRPEVARGATPLHLLRHRSGLGDYLQDPEFRADPDRFRSVNDLMALIRDRPLLFEPGSRERYSNSGFVLLGALIEAVTGRPYDRVLEEWVLEPAGMRRTSLLGPGPDGDDALPYRRGEGGRLEPAADLHARRGSPAGGGYATARDLRAFAEALLADRLLEPEWTNLLLAGYERGRGRVGAGWAGGAPGVSAVLELEPDGTVVAVVANRDPPAATRFGTSIARWLRERGPAEGAGDAEKSGPTPRAPAR